jgi:hypothetical protein
MAAVLTDSTLLDSSSSKQKQVADEGHAMPLRNDLTPRRLATQSGGAG